MKSVTIEELREKLDEVIAEVEKGETVYVTKDGQVLVKFTPAPAVIPPREPGRFQDVPISPRPKNLKTDPVEMVIEDRASELKKYGI